MRYLSLSVKLFSALIFAAPSLALAQALAADPAASKSPMAGLMTFFPILAFGAIFYFLLYRPQQQQAKERKNMLLGVKRSDRVLTAGGIYGTVVNARGDILDLKLADNLKVEVNRQYVAKVIVTALAENGAKEPAIVK